MHMLPKKGRFLNQAGLASDLRIPSSFAISAHVNRFGPVGFRHRVARSTAKIVKAVEDRQGCRRSSRLSKIVKAVEDRQDCHGFHRAQCLDCLEHLLEKAATPAHPAQTATTSRTPSAAGAIPATGQSRRASAQRTGPRKERGHALILAKRIRYSRNAEYQGMLLFRGRCKLPS